MTILLICVIAAELLLILFFARKTNDFIRKISMGNQSEVIRERQSPYAWLKAKWAEMNFKPIEEEAKIDTGHNYDGIRELDNIIPPWFTTAFVLTILFGIVYLYRYHIARSAPLQIEEYEIQMAKADLEHDEFLKREANSIDESSITLMTGADLDAGRKVFVTLCAACHKMDGGGLVGPNLTDDYTLHGGSLQDVFKTIKYGVPEKGMISWKEQLSPMQMAQVSNYVLTLRGTNPPDAKEKQGELYIPEAVKSDSLSSNATPVDTMIMQ
jgi:cytochrome c oxidase cbb3-type subunit 3